MSTQAYGLFGHPLGHSISPQIHTTLFNLTACDGSYRLFDTPEDQIHAAFEQSRETLCGYNCTIPYKQTIIPLLDTISGEARDMGAVNTVAVREGKLHGYNTDILGFLTCLATDGISLAGKRVLVLGSGGTSRMMLYAAKTGGAASVTVAARRVEAARELHDQVMALSDVHGGFDLIFNGTSAGMWPKIEGTALRADQMAGCEYLFDAVYNPPVTQLMREAQAAGARVRGGLLMLVSQAAAAQEIWRGMRFTREQLLATERDAAFRLAYQRLHQARECENLVLIGFMATGKSTLGRQLAAAMDMEFLDTDALIEERAGMPIPEIFAQFGEAKFRELEHEVAESLCEKKNTVISTGGGMPLACGEALRRAGFVVFLNPPEEFIARNAGNGEGRPLFRENWQARLHDRLPAYRACAHAQLRAVGTPAQRARLVAELV